MRKLSIVIPAFNEEKYLPACLDSLRAALAACAERVPEHELIVSDNNSTDATAEVARRGGARVVFEPHNQISRARNAGAAAASGDWLLFVDADCVVHPDTLADMLDHIDSGGFVGGGCAVRLDRGPIWARAVAATAVGVFRVLKLAGGSFLFCRADAFRDVGGFPEELYAAEEVPISRALKRWGRERGLGFAFLTRRPLVTSARKLDRHGLRGFLWIVLRGTIAPRSTLGSRRHLGFFYDGKR